MRRLVHFFIEGTSRHTRILFWGTAATAYPGACAALATYGNVPQWNVVLLVLGCAFGTALLASAAVDRWRLRRGQR